MWEGIPELLQTWRIDVAHLSLRQTSERAQQIAKKSGDNEVSFGHTKIAHWETKQVRPNHIPDYGLRILDATYSADGALVGIARALSTPRALKPRWQWVHTFLNYSDTYVQAANHSQHGGPVWAWLRPGNEMAGWIDADVRWGIFRVKVSRHCGPGGLFLTSPVSTDHPAAFINWNYAPGWVDFGHGQIPPSLGVDIVSALELLTVVETAGAFKKLWHHYLDTLIGPLSRREAALREVPRFLSAKPGLLRDLLNKDSTAGNLLDLVGNEPPDKKDKEHLFTPEEFRRLREHRSLSRSEVSRAVSSLSANLDVSEDQIAHLEEGRNVTVELLVSCLDMIYGAGGHSFRQTVPVQIQGHRNASVSFPPHWVGPVSLRFSARNKDVTTGIAELHWKEWMTTFTIRSDVSVTFRKDAPDSTPLVIQIPMGWEVTAEIGYNELAIDINDNWTFEDRPEFRKSLLDRLVPAGLGLWGRSPSDVKKWLRRFR